MIGRTNAITIISGGGGGDEMTLYHIEQTISGNNCTLSFTTYNGQASDNYWVGTRVVGDNIYFYINGENGSSGGDDMKLYHVAQTITDNNCTLALTDYDGEESENYWVGTKTTGNGQQLFFMPNEDVMGEIDEALQELNSGGGV